MYLQININVNKFRIQFTIILHGNDLFVYAAPPNLLGYDFGIVVSLHSSFIYTPFDHLILLQGSKGGFVLFQN